MLISYHVQFLSFNSLNLLKVTDKLQMLISVFMYKYDHDVIPTTFVYYFCQVADLQSYLTRHSTGLHILCKNKSKEKYNKNHMDQVVE